MDRPAPTTDLAADDFRRWYRLKEELLAFCRQQRLPTVGGKREIADRIARYLATGERPVAARAAPQARGGSPTAELTAETTIWPCFRCGQAARAFFVAAIGPRFHFDGQMRAFPRDNPGKTLGDAIADWHPARAAGPQEMAIAPQFEYNRHLRNFFRANPQATRAEAIAAWMAHRSRPDDGR